MRQAVPEPSIYRREKRLVGNVVGFGKSVVAAMPVYLDDGEPVLSCFVQIWDEDISWPGDPVGHSHTAAIVRNRNYLFYQEAVRLIALSAAAKGDGDSLAAIFGK